MRASTRVLVGCATAHGSTGEIAEHLAERLTRHPDVEVQELATPRRWTASTPSTPS